MQTANFNMRIFPKCEGFKINLFLNIIQNIDGYFSVTFVMKILNIEYAGTDIF
jgi:hypothetical protein